MDEIEFEEPQVETCPCCGTTTTRLVRYVTRDGDAFAVYLAAFTSGTGHDPSKTVPDYVSVLVGLGRWGRECYP
ncbi:hypothetical protein [Microvirga sp. 2TAF3]|uniref:hypothetical protein n=1 Tax=Microvirga sp. 2TAF3 TaxID=3233014 RepID=UPI003F985B9F